MGLSIFLEIRTIFLRFSSWSKWRNCVHERARCGFLQHKIGSSLQITFKLLFSAVWHGLDFNYTVQGLLGGGVLVVQQNRRLKFLHFWTCYLTGQVKVVSRHRVGPDRKGCHSLHHCQFVVGSEVNGAGLRRCFPSEPHNCAERRGWGQAGSHWTWEGEKVAFHHLH